MILLKTLPYPARFNIMHIMLSPFNVWAAGAIKYVNSKKQNEQLFLFILYTNTIYPSVLVLIQSY